MSNLFVSGTRYIQMQLILFFYHIFFKKRLWGRACFRFACAEFRNSVSPADTQALRSSVSSIFPKNMVIFKVCLCLYTAILAHSVRKVRAPLRVERFLTESRGNPRKSATEIYRYQVFAIDSKGGNVG